MLMTAQAESWTIEIGTIEETKPKEVPSIAEMVNIVILAARGFVAYIHCIWINEGVIMPGSVLRFVVGGLIGFMEMKSQGQTGFPFKTNPREIKVAVTSLIMYGLAAGVEHVIISATSSTPTSLYAIIARYVKVVSVYLLVGALVSLVYI